MIEVSDLRKTFRVHQKSPGLVASMKSLFRREYIEKVAVAGASFNVGEGEIVPGGDGIPEFEGPGWTCRVIFDI